ncbi:MAG: hypothetical protein O7G31_06625 [Calditrichaeota bacterium]|nr:hypothetical protein [Calditrichota bacterium]
MTAVNSLMNKIGIRSEVKHWDSRTTISPQDLPALPKSLTIRFENDGERSRPFKQRVFSNEEILAAGQKGGARTEIGHDLDDCPVIIGTKEIKEVYMQVETTETDAARVLSNEIATMLPHFSFDPQLNQMRLTEFLTADETATLRKMARKTGLGKRTDELIARQESLIEHGKAYMLFSHAHKGQAYNMRMLQRFIDRRCILLDYELLRTEQEGGWKRTVSYGNWAGIIGMLEALWAYGEHFSLRRNTCHPFRKIRGSRCFNSTLFEYSSLADIKRTVQEIATEIRENGLPEAVTIGITGHRGEAGSGVLELLQKCGLPLIELDPDKFVAAGRKQLRLDAIYLIKLDYEHLYRPKSTADIGNATLKSLIKGGQGQLLESNLDTFFDKLSIFINCIVWNKESPRLLTNGFLRKKYEESKTDRHRLLPVIGDITCDPNGSVQCCRDTYPDKPVYMWIPKKGKEPILPDFDLKKTDANFEYFDLSRRGFVVMAVTNLPCEIPRDASNAFSKAFCEKRRELGGKSYVECLAEADFSADFEDCGLPPALRDAVILYKGQFNGSNRQLMLKEICLAMLETETIKPEHVLSML